MDRTRELSDPPLLRRHDAFHGRGLDPSRVLHDPRNPGLHGYPRINLLRWRWGRLLIQGGLRQGLRAAAVVVFLLVIAAGIVGHPNPTRNLAPTTVWILWWVGFAYVSALVGNLWAVMGGGG